MTREEALTLVNEYVKNQNLVKHMIAAEAIMRYLARHFGENEEEWALAGLLHDIDVEITNADLTIHSKVGGEILEKAGVPANIVRAVVSHNPVHGVLPESRMEKALFATDPLTGMITTVALVRPDKKLASVETKSVMKRIPEKRFAAGVRREDMATCAEFGFELEDFISLGIEAMQSVSDELGL